MTEAAKEARRAYQRKITKNRRANDPEYAERIRAYKRKWQAEHKDKVKAYQEKYWERKAADLHTGAADQ